MHAAHHESYGSPDVLGLTEVDRPTIGDHEVLVRVHASPVTAGDRRLRSADFPGISALPGRLMFGVLRPKHRIPGTAFAGRVVAVGAAVTRFAVGDDIFGGADRGAQAEYLAVREDGPVARMPRGVGYAEAAAVPYGAVTALRFLRDLGGIEAGHRVLILGAAGGVGRIAVQLAKHFGAEVTAVAGTRSLELVRSLGADRVIDYRSNELGARGERYDLVLDPGVSRFAAVRGLLVPQGRYLSLHVELGLLLRMAFGSLLGGPRAICGVALSTQKDMEEAAALLEAGAFMPVLDRHYPLARIAEAHARLESGHAEGTVIVTVAAAEPVRLAA